MRNRLIGWLPLLTSLLFLAGCSSTGRRYSWGWYTVSPFASTGRDNLQFLLRGLWPTISVSVLAFIFSLIIGLLIGMLALMPQRLPRWINRIYVEGIRAIPLLVLLLWVYYGLPISMGIELDVFTAGVLALALSDSAFEAEILRDSSAGDSTHSAPARQPICLRAQNVFACFRDWIGRVDAQSKRVERDRISSAGDLYGTGCGIFAADFGCLLFCAPVGKAHGR